MSYPEATQMCPHFTQYYWANELLLHSHMALLFFKLLLAKERLCFTPFLKYEPENQMLICIQPCDGKQFG